MFENRIINETNSTACSLKYAARLRVTHPFFIKKTCLCQTREPTQMPPMPFWVTSLVQPSALLYLKMQDCSSPKRDMQASYRWHNHHLPCTRNCVVPCADLQSDSSPANVLRRIFHFHKRNFVIFH